jgi:hypothetical protein
MPCKEQLTKKILFLQPQHLALNQFVVWIKHLADVFELYLASARLIIVSVVEIGNQRIPRLGPSKGGACYLCLCAGSLLPLNHFIDIGAKLGEGMPCGLEDPEIQEIVGQRRARQEFAER